MQLRFIAMLVFSLARTISYGQAIGIQRPELFSASSISLRYENDVAGKTDYYYTQGTRLSVTTPALKRLPLNRLCIRMKGDDVIWGMALEHVGYTPASIQSDSILYGDRPFAAAFMLQYFGIAVNSDRHTRIGTQLSIGLLGPGAGGKEIQSEIHRHTHNIIPHGWQYQVNNDLLLNYYLRYDRGIMNIHNLLALHISGGLSAGTYSNKLFSGLQVMAGRMNNTLYEGAAHAFQCYVSYAPTVHLIGYDATLQGGLFSSNDPYTIADTDISRITFKQEAEAVISYRKILLSAGFTWLTREFRTGKSHAWGSLQLAVSL